MVTEGEHQEARAFLKGASGDCIIAENAYQSWLTLCELKDLLVVDDHIWLQHAYMTGRCRQRETFLQLQSFVETQNFKLILEVENKCACPIHVNFQRLSHFLIKLRLGNL